MDARLGTGTPVEILLVEDNLDDVFLTQEALRESKISNNLSVAGDGRQALDFLRREGAYSGAPRPDIVLLDLNLPKKDGRWVLEQIKTDDRLKHLTVVIMTTSRAEHDVLKSYRLHANCYVTKPVDFDEFISIVHSIEEFWFTVVRLPKDGS